MLQIVNATLLLDEILKAFPQTPRVMGKYITILKSKYEYNTFSVDPSKESDEEILARFYRDLRLLEIPWNKLLA